MKRMIALLLCAACLCSCVAFAAAGTGKTTIGGKSADTVTVDMHKGITADVTLPQGSLSKDQAARDIISTASAKGNLIAAVNGGFFNASYSALDGYGTAPRCYADIVKDGMVVNGGGQSAVYLGFTRDGKALIDDVTITLYVSFNGKKTAIQGVNSYVPEPESVLLFSPEAGSTLPVPANVKVAKIVDGKVKEVMTSGTMACAPDTYYYVCGKNVPSSAVPAPGTAISFYTEFSKSAWNDVTTAVSCGPWLLHDGKNVFAENSKYDYLSEQNVSETAVAARTFAAILSNGDLMLGACTASPKQVAEYLLSVGAKDAMLLDGGASSMLYADGNTLRSAGRKLNNVICIYDGKSTSDDAPKIVPTNQKLIVNGAEKKTEIYNINDANYFKLRDVATLLNGTRSQFSVVYDGETKTILVKTGEAYSPEGGELAIPSAAKMAEKAAGAAKSTQSLRIDGKAVDLTPYNIGGNNYFGLRDLGKALNFDVSYDEATATMVVKSK